MSKGITISVTAETNAGGRRHMEDYLAVKLQPNEKLLQVPHLREQAFIGVFDGHGGKEAAKFAREHLWDVIQNQPKYRLNDVESVRESLREAFQALHRDMEPLRVTWKTNKMGDLSTAGTTASTVIFRQNHIFVANVGDSTAVLAETNPKAGKPGQHPVIAKVLTKDHKPDDPDEIKQVESLGGRVMVSRKGVPRVVWERRRNGSTNGDQVDFIPFLSVSRSLGDFWSYCPRSGEFVVSPKPDVHVHSLNPKVQKYIIIASDGLWNVMSPKEVVEFIWDYEHVSEEKLHQPRDVVRAVINEALSRWNSKHLLADNIAVLIAFLSEDGSSSPSVADINATLEEEEAPTSSSPTNAATPSPTPDSNAEASSTECRDNTTPPPSSSISPASSASPSAGPSPSTSTSPSSSSSSSTSASITNSSSPQQQQQPAVINTVRTTKSGSTSHYRETFSDGVTVECHTEIRLRHRKRHHGSRSKVKGNSSSNTSINGGAGTSQSVDSTESLRRSPLKRERLEDASVKEELAPTKRTKLDLPDSGCDCSSDKMDTEDNSPSATNNSSSEPASDQAGSTSEYSSGVFSDDSECKNKLAKKHKSSEPSVSCNGIGEEESMSIPTPVVSVS